MLKRLTTEGTGRNEERSKVPNQYHDVIGGRVYRNGRAELAGHADGIDLARPFDTHVPRGPSHRGQREETI